MNDSERLAMAAHLHVALRRKVGRVTDTEWMASNSEYGLAMVDLALQHAEEHMDQELGRLALRFGAALTLRTGRAVQGSSTGAGFSPTEPGPVSAAEARDNAPWWDSHFSNTRAPSRGRDSTMPPDPRSTWPPSALNPAGNPSDAPMPLRRGRYVGGLR